LTARPNPEQGEQDYRRLSFWHEQLSASMESRQRLQDEVCADVAIIGAGYTGLWTAWYLKQLDPGISVAILEADIAGFGASGRNGGWCSAYLSGIGHWLDDKEHRAAGIRLQNLMFQTVTDVGRSAEQAGIDCHYERAGALEVAVNAAQLARLEREFEHLQQLGFTDADFRWLDRAALRETLNIDGALAAIHLPHCAAIQPARLARGLANALERRGVKIFEHSPVRAFGGGVVRGDHGIVTCDTTIVATEGYGATLPGRKRQLIPVHSMMVATEPLDEAVFERLHLDRRYCFGNLDRIVTYGQRTADNRIAFGCRGEYYYGSGIRSRFDGEEPGFQQVRDTLLRFFPDLRGVRFTHAWGGSLGVSRTMRPAVCFDPGTRSGWAGGYFGNGVAAAHLAGQTLADLILGRDSERLHTPWVNPQERDRKWEPEPLRWMGFRSTRALMEVADRCEYRGGQRIPGLIDRLLP
jgi:glycine/D-amino acid oxidase-like deaminating enzyme